MRRAVSSLHGWLVQRMTAVYMLLFLVFLLDRPTSYLAWHIWIVIPMVSITAFVFCAALLAHMWGGLRDVILNYVKPLAVRVGTLALRALGLLGLGAWVIRIVCARLRKSCRSAAYLSTTTVHRWAIKMLPVLAAVFLRRKRHIGLSWKMDETNIKVAGQWKYLYCAVDRAGDTVDFLLAAKRDLAAARRFLKRAINLHNVPEKITIDKSGANTADIESVKADACVDILMRQNKYLNNIVEQDHRTVKRITQSMLGFKSFWSARIIIAWIETMHMIRKG